MEPVSLRWYTDLSLANKISFSRILVIPLLILFLSVDTGWCSLVACILFLLASVTDIIDGYVARKYNHISQLGKLLDPMADKLMIFAVLIMLLYLGRIHFLFVILLITRDVAVNSLRGIATQEGVVISASRLGKYKTTTQVVSLLGLTLGPENRFFEINWFAIGEIFLFIATALALVSAYQYFKAYRVGSMPPAGSN